MRKDARGTKREFTEREEIDNPPSKRSFSKKKVALVVGYSGTNYCGLQINPEVNSIEKVLEEAIFQAGGISEDNHGDLKKIGWTRTARTDKGVHALANVISLKMNSETTIEEINAKLPQDIHVFQKISVTRGFHSKNMCTSRFYEYICPSYLFKRFANREEFASTPYEELAAHKLSEGDLQRINEILGKYVGTLNFHNFTIRRQPKDPSCKRYIMSFGCERTLELEGVQFVELIVHGQSFMMHQIRKMIGVLLAVFHEFIPLEDMSSNGLFSLKTFGAPMSPGMGLFLHKCNFDIYNLKLQGLSSGRQNLLFEDLQPEFDRFKFSQIHPQIARQEAETHDFFSWAAENLFGRNDWNYRDPIQHSQSSEEADQTPSE